MIELLHGQSLEDFRRRVDISKLNEPVHDSEWVKSFMNLPFETKIQKSITRIVEWIIYHEGMVYVSYSGGADSTVLLHLCRRIFSEIEAVFCDTGLEYPELKAHALKQPNVTVIKPKMSYKQVVEELGYPVPTKEIADIIHGARLGQKSRLDKLNGKSLYKDGTKSKYNAEKWKYLLDAPFKISHRCCDEMKKKPFKRFEKESGKKAIMGITAEESRMRKTEWQRSGCNVFSDKRPRSNPLSAWTRQDILRYIKEFDLEIPSVYGKILKDNNGKLYTSGVERTGCMSCMFGVHLEKEPNRFQQMAVTHPKYYDAFINKLGQGAVMDYIGVNYK